MEDKTLGYVSSETVERLGYPKDVLEEYNKKPITELDSTLLCSAAIASKSLEEKQILLEEILGREEICANDLKRTLDHVYYYNSDFDFHCDFEKNLILKLADTIAEYGKRYQELVSHEAEQLVQSVFRYMFTNKDERRNKFIREYAINLKDLAYKYLTK